MFCIFFSQYKYLLPCANSSTCSWRLQSCMSSAWPLCMGLRSWKANTASAWSSLKRARSWAGVRRYSSRPSPQVTRPSTSSSPPASQSPPARICRMYGWFGLVVPNCRAHRSSYFAAEKDVEFFFYYVQLAKITFGECSLYILVV
jgi:hypothetical protein